MNKLILPLAIGLLIASCKTIQVSNQSDIEKKAKPEVALIPKGGIFYRLPATRFKVLVKGKRTTSKSPLLTSKNDVMALLKYPIPFIDKEMDGVVEIESVSLIPETVADEKTLFRVEFGEKSPFRKFDFAYTGNTMNVPGSADIKIEGSPVTFVVGLAGAVVKSVIVGGGGGTTALAALVAKENPEIAIAAVQEVKGLPDDLMLQVDTAVFKDRLLDFAQNNVYKGTDGKLFIQRDSLIKAVSGIYHDTRKDSSIKPLGVLAVKAAALGAKLGTVTTVEKSPPLSSLNKSQQEMIGHYNQIKDRQLALVSLADTKEFSLKMDYLKAEEAKYVRLIGGFREVTDYEFSFDWYPGTDPDSMKVGDENFEFSVKLADKASMAVRAGNVSAIGKGTGIYYRIPLVSRCELKVTKITPSSTVGVKETKKEVFSRVVYQRIAQLGALVSLPDLKGYRRNQGFAINPELGTLETFSLSGKAISAEDTKAITDFANSIPTIKEQRKQYGYDQEQKALDQQLKLIKAQSDIDAAISAINSSKDSSIDDIQKANQRIQALIDQLTLLKKLEELQKK